MSNLLRVASPGALLASAFLVACSGGNGATAAATSGHHATTTAATTGSGGTGGHRGAGGAGGLGTGGGTGGPTTGSGGAGGVGGSGPFVTAKHPTQPTVRTFGGAILTQPKVQPIVYATDVHAADVGKFVTELAGSPTWSAETAEYGVGPLTVLPTIELPGTAPGMIDDTKLASDLAMQTSGPNPAWGAADPSTIYLFIQPLGTLVTTHDTCCQSFDGYHFETMVNGTSVAYASVCTCPGFDGPGIDGLQQVTVAITHELAEAATDPFPRSDPAYSQNDDLDLDWTLAGGGEVADMCQFNTDSYAIPPGATYMVQRSWSNAAAKAGTNPCVPAPVDPFFNSMPVMPDKVHLTGLGTPTRGVTIAMGSTRTIDVDLYSEAPTKGPWKVTAYDLSSAILGGPKLLDVSLDHGSGQNGEVLKLTIKALAFDPQHGDAMFMILSDLGGQENISIGLVTP